MPTYESIVAEPRIVETAFHPHLWRQSERKKRLTIEYKGISIHRAFLLYARGESAESERGGRCLLPLWQTTAALLICHTW